MPVRDCLAVDEEDRPMSRQWSTVLACTSVVLALLLAMVLAPARSAATTSSYDWPQFDGNAQHSGTNTQETIISASNIANLHLLFQVTLPVTSFADNAPAYLSAVSTPSGVRDLLFVATYDGHIL